MKKKAIIISSIACVCLFAGIKINNFLIGQKILGPYTSINSAFLKSKPIKRDIINDTAKAGIKSSLCGIRFEIPKVDTLKTFKLREVYRSFSFQDSSKLKVYRDTVKVDFIHMFKPIGNTDYDVINSYIKDNKITSNFDLLLFSYFKTPDDISFFNLSKENTIIQYSFLKLKDLAAGADAEKGLYYFKLKNLEGFQYGRPGSSIITSLHIYTNKGEEYLLVFTKFNQEQIDYVIASIATS